MSRHGVNRDVMDKLQDDVSEVTHLMKNNIEKVVDRGDRLDDLQERSEDLHSSSIQFHKSSRSLKRKMCCQNAKMTCCIIVVVLVIIIGIVLIVLFTIKPWENNENSNAPNHNKTITVP